MLIRKVYMKGLRLNMNSRQLKYAIALYKSLNFSHVAEQMGISQPALSKQILNLESDLGVKLFDRDTTPLTVTPAGEYFFNKAQKLLYDEEQLLKSMSEFKSKKRGRLTIGVSPFRCQYLLPAIIKKIRDKYPNVQIVLHEAESATLKKEVAEGKYDFAIVNLPVDETVLDVTPIESDTLVVAVPKSLSASLPETNGAVLKIGINQLKDIPFVMVSRHQEMRQLFEKNCMRANFEPNIAVQVIGISTAWALCREGIGATLLPLQFVKSAPADDTINLYALKHSIHSRQPAIVVKKGQQLSEYANYAIGLFVK